jgi:SNF2 family DNA or RNA helicase
MSARLVKERVTSKTPARAVKRATTVSLMLKISDGDHSSAAAASNSSTVHSSGATNSRNATKNVSATKTISATKNISALVDLLSQGFNSVDVTAEAEEGKSAVIGFAPNIKLLNHQAVGRAWMQDMENSEYSGGILADDMGLVYFIFGASYSLNRYLEWGRPSRFFLASLTA